MRGKYTNNRLLSNNRVPEPPSSDSDPKPDNKVETGIESEIENSLTPEVPQDLEELNDRSVIVPEHRKGKLTFEKEVTKDEDGNPVSESVEIGIIDKDGNETSIINQEFDKSGKVEMDFDLKEGERIYKRETFNGKGGESLP